MVISEEERSEIISFVRDSLPENTELKVQALEEIRDKLDEKYADNILMQHSVRDAFMVALKRNGHSMNTLNEDEVEQAKNDLIDHLQIIKNEALNSDLSIKDSVDKMIKSMCEYFAGKTELNKHTVYDVISIIDEEDTIEEWNTSELDKCYENIKEKDNKNFEEER